MTLYCPVGDGAFDDWVDQCPECGRNLQEEPFDERKFQGSDAVVWLVTAPNEPEAHLWANTLRDLDIQVFLRSGGPGVGAWASVSSFEQDLLVRERDLVRARRVVRDLLVGAAIPRAGVRVRRAAPIINPASRRQG